MNLKKLLALLLAVVMLLSFAACDSSDAEVKDENDKSSSQTEETAPQETEPQETEPAVEVKPVDNLSITLTMGDGSSVGMFVYSNYDGTVHVDYVGETTKRTDMDESVMTQISEAFAQSGLSALADRYDEYNVVCGSFSVSLTDGSYIGGEVYAETLDQLPVEFLNGYDIIDDCFLALTQDVPEYVPQPSILGNVAENDLAAINAILEGLQFENIDAFAISEVVKDEFFATTMGLSSDEGIVSGVQLIPMMMAQAYSLNIVTLEDGADINAITSDFAENIDWMKWVCVAPDHALIATKGNQALILLGQAELYTISADAIEAAGWTTVATLDNPEFVEYVG